MFRSKEVMVPIKSQEDLEFMRRAGEITATILDGVQTLIRPGVSTGELDEYAEKRCKDFDVIPAFKGYRGFTGCFCISINDEVVHGIPSKKRFLNEGDIVGFDFGVIYKGWFGDSARTYAVGKISKEAQSLMDATKKSLELGIAQCQPGNHLYDIGHAIQNYVEGLGYGVVREFVGHGIGRSLHEEPQVPNYGTEGKGMLLKAGMVLAIEPMINAGGREVKVLSDGWTAVTEDKSLSAHFEHTVAITEDGPEILTLPPDAAKKREDKK